MSDWTGDHSDTLPQQLIHNVQVHGSSSLLPSAVRTPSVLPSQRDFTGATHDITEGIMTWADEMRPEAFQLDAFSWYAL